MDTVHSCMYNCLPLASQTQTTSQCSVFTTEEWNTLSETNLPNHSAHHYECLQEVTTRVWKFQNIDQILHITVSMTNSIINKAITFFCPKKFSQTDQNIGQIIFPFIVWKPKKTTRDSPPSSVFNQSSLRRTLIDVWVKERAVSHLL